MSRVAWVAWFESGRVGLLNWFESSRVGLSWVGSGHEFGGSSKKKSDRRGGHTLKLHEVSWDLDKNLYYL